MHIKTNAATGTDPAALQTLLAPLREQPPDFLLFTCSCTHDLDHVRAALSAVNARALHGATTCLGVMTNQGMLGRDGDGMGYFAIWDTEGAYGSAAIAIEEDAAGAAARAVETALQRADRPGEAPDLIWVSASPGQEEAIIAGIERIVGSDVPIVGGSAADNTVAGDWSVFGADGSHANGVQVSVLFPTQPLAAEFTSGYAPTGKTAVVTRAEGRRLFELDNRPAGEVYQEHTSLSFGPVDAPEGLSILSQSSFDPLGVVIGGVSNIPYHLLIHAAVLHNDGAIDFFSDVHTGTTLHFMSGSTEGLTQRAGRVAKRARDKIETPPAGALVIYCAGCMLSVTDHMDKVAAGVDESLGGAPFLGIFTFGEQGYALDQTNSHGNLMISCVTFASEPA